MVTRDKLNRVLVALRCEPYCRATTRRLARIAFSRENLSKATGYRVLMRLRALGYVEHFAYGVWQLTPLGKESASRLVVEATTRGTSL
jgi:Mn-dependent DtxR family transcriptional regulator